MRSCQLHIPFFMREAFVYKMALWDNAAYNTTPSRFQGAVQTNLHYHHMLQPENQNKYTRLNILNNKITNTIAHPSSFRCEFPTCANKNR